MSLLCLAPHQVAPLWAAVEPLLEQGYAAVDEFTPPDLRDWLADGNGLLWVYVDGERIIAALVTSLVQKRSGLTCRMVCCGGERMELWKTCALQIEDYARAEGCVKVTAEGRPGWGRVLPGFAVLRTTLEKRL